MALYKDVLPKESRWERAEKIQAPILDVNFTVHNVQVLQISLFLPVLLELPSIYGPSMTNTCLI